MGSWCLVSGCLDYIGASGQRARGFFNLLNPFNIHSTVYTKKVDRKPKNQKPLKNLSGTWNLSRIRSFCDQEK